MMSVSRGVVAWLLAALIISIVPYLYFRAVLPTPSVHVRWAATVDARERAALEQTFHLSKGEFLDGRTWSYQITDVRRANVAALVTNPGVEDTDGIDPRSFHVNGAPQPLDGAGTALIIGFGISTLVFAGLAVRRGIVFPLSEKRRRALSFSAAVLIGTAFLGPLLIYGPFEQEEAKLGIFAGQVHYRALLEGHWLYWLNNLGFGTPLPIGSRLDLHPLFALTAVAPLRVALSALWVAHVVLMIVYFRRLAAVTGIREPIRSFLLLCYVFSVVSVCYFYENDWVTHVVGWTLLPALVFYLREAVVGGAATNFWFTAIRLAVLFGLWFINSHPGYIAPVALPVIVYAVVAAPPRRSVYLCLAVAFALCVAICAERLYFFASEMWQFPASLERANAPGLRLADYAAAAVAPVWPVSPSMRLPFIGVGLGLAAVAALFGLRHHHDRHVRACCIAVLASVLLSLVPPRILLPLLWNAPAGTWYFRDTMVFFGLLSGGLVLQRWFDSPHSFSRGFAWTLVLVQVLQQGATVFVGYREYDAHRGFLEFYRHQGHAVGLGQTLTAFAKELGPRLYMSQRVQDLMSGALTPYGVHFPTDLVFLGLNPINGWFKSVSMDRLYPSWALMNGCILGERDVVDNESLLDALGINMVLMTEAEGSIPQALKPLQRIHVDAGTQREDLVLLGNLDAWPTAVLLTPAARDVVLPQRPGCSNAAALCRDYAALVHLRISDDVRLTAENGRYTARFRPADSERVVMISAAYRPEWQAMSSSGRLRIDPLAGAFIGVTVPPHVDAVDVSFQPRARIALTWFSGMTLLLLVGALVGMSWQRRRAHQAATPSPDAVASASRS